MVVAAVVLGAILTAALVGYLRWSSAVGALTGDRPGLRDAAAFLFPSRTPLRPPSGTAEPPSFLPIADVVPDAFREPADPQVLDPLPPFETTSGANAAGRSARPYVPEPDRVNILLLGIAGRPQERGGGLLTDAIVIASLDQATQEVATISLPRDLYVELPEVGGRFKINAAYALGLQTFGDGLGYAMETVERVAGVPIHHAFRIDMPAFTEIVDALGGVDVFVHRAFTGTDREDISVERGMVHMDGATALTYARSRRTTNDFDRSRRQREVLVAIRKRLAELRNPLEMLGILEIVSRHAQTTLSAPELRRLYELVANGGAADIIDLGFDTSADGHLQAMRSPHGEYILVPRSGDYAQIQRDVREVFARSDPEGASDAPE